MRNRFVLLAMILLVTFSLVTTVDTASAQLLAGVNLGYGTTNFSELYGDDGPTYTQWSAGVWADFRYDDLLFTGLYQSSLAIPNDVDIGRHLAQVGANYRFFEDGPLRVYGGLGYQLVSTRFKTEQVEEGDESRLLGHGFAGQVVVDIAITEDISTTATITGNPWMNWSHKQEGTTTESLQSGSSFTAKLDVVYDFSEEFGVHLGAIGGTYGVPEFKVDETKKGKTSSVYASVNLGVTHRF